MSGGNSVDMVYLDFAKAFDKVEYFSRNVLASLVNWVYHVLTDRTHFVRLQGGVSLDSHVLSGIPQGTVLGPLRFIILMGDINHGISSSSIVSFVDDTRLYHGVDDCTIVQNDLNSVRMWLTSGRASGQKRCSNILH